MNEFILLFFLSLLFWKVIAEYDVAISVGSEMCDVYTFSFDWSDALFISLFTSLGLYIIGVAMYAVFLVI